MRPVDDTEPGVGGVIAQHDDSSGAPNWSGERPDRHPSHVFHGPCAVAESRGKGAPQTRESPSSPLAL